jgi:hypothetical protein
MNIRECCQPAAAAKGNISNGLSHFGVLTLAAALTRGVPAIVGGHAGKPLEKVSSGMNHVGFRQTDQAGAC